MNHFTRSALLLTLFAALTPLARAADVDPLLPAETEHVAYVNVRQLLESDIVKKYSLRSIRPESNLEGTSGDVFLKVIALYPMKDVETVHIGLWYVGEQAHALAVVRGTFDPETLAAAAENVAMEKATKVSIVQEGVSKFVRFDGELGGTAFAALADKGTLLIGTDSKALAAGITAAAKGTKPALGKELATLVLKQDAKASMFVCGIGADFYKGLFPGMDVLAFSLSLLGWKESEWPAGIKPLVPKIASHAAVVRIGKEATLDLTFGMTDDDAAKAFNAVVVDRINYGKAFLSLLEMRTNDPDLVGIPIALWGVLKNLIETLVSTAKGKDVTVSTRVTGAALVNILAPTVTVKPRKGEVVIIADSVRAYELYMGARPGSEVRTGLVKIGRVQEVSEPVTGMFVEHRDEYTMFKPSGAKPTDDPRVVKTAHAERSR